MSPWANWNARTDLEWIFSIPFETQQKISFFPLALHFVGNELFGITLQHRALKKSLPPEFVPITIFRTCRRATNLYFQEIFLTCSRDSVSKVVASRCNSSLKNIGDTPDTNIIVIILKSLLINLLIPRSEGNLTANYLSSEQRVFLNQF